MSKIFNIKIITPDRDFFSGEIESLVITTPTGEMGIMYNTMPLVVSLKTGVLKMLHKGKWMEAVTGEGFVRTMSNIVTIHAAFAEWPYEVNRSRARIEADILAETLKKEQSYKEYKLAKAQLARQFARLKIKNDKEM